MNQSNCNIETKTTYKQFTLEERKIIQCEYNKGTSYQVIANKLGRSKSSISYEISHNGTLKLNMRNGKKKQYKYYAKTAHNKANENRRINSISETNKMYIKEFRIHAKLHPTHSVEQLYYEIKAESKPSLRTFYDWLYMGLISCNQYKPKRNKKTGDFNDSEGRKNIAQRAEDFSFEQDDYSIAGHYEVDTVIDGLKNGVASHIQS